MAGEWLLGESPSVDTVSALNPDQEAVLKKLSTLLQEQIGTGITAYSGSMYAPTSELNNTLFNYLNTALGGDSASTTKANSTIDTLLNKYTGDYTEEFDPAYINSYFEKSIKNPAMKEFTETMLPSIAEKYAARNATGSGAMTKDMFDAASDLQSNLSGQLADLMYQGSEATANRNVQREQIGSSTVQNLISQLLGQDATKITLLNSALPIAQQQQTLEQRPYTEEYSKWSSSQAYNNPWLQYLNQVLGTDALQNIVNPGSEGLMPSLIQGGSTMGAAAIGAGMI